MKVLQVTNHFSPCVGGVERVVEGLCKSLMEKGHVSDVACLDTCAYSDKKLPSSEEYEGARVFRLPYTDLKFYKLAPGVLRLLRDYDVIHVHGMGFFSDYLAITRHFHKKPLILNTHGGFFHTEERKWIKKIYSLWNRLSLRAFDRIIADSGSDETAFSAISSNIEHIPNGIILDEFRVERRPGPCTLLYVGRVSRNKRIDCLIETAALVKKTVPEVRLEIVGEDWKGARKELEALAEKRGVKKNIEFFGKIDKSELLERLSRATFFVSASEYEGFGISAIESMAAGCPVVLNDIPAFREFVSHGRNGFLVDFSDYVSAAALLTDLAGKDLSEISREAVATAARYDWKTVVGKIESVYNKALEGP